MSPKWEMIFTPLPPLPPHSLQPLKKKKSDSFQIPLVRACSATRQSDVRENQIKNNLILLSKNKTSRIIASYRRYHRSFHLLSPLVFTVTDLSRTRKAISKLEKMQVSNILQQLALHPQTPQLNDSFALPVYLRSFRFTKNSQPFSNSYFVPC